MSPSPPRSPADQLSTIIRTLIATLDSHSMWQWGRLARPLAVLITSRLIGIQRLFSRTAERVAAGTYRPGRHPTPRRPAAPHKRRPDPLPREAAWLLRLLQETAAYGSQLDYLFRDPEMVALMAAAPATLRRPLRSLCRMLGVIPPPVLALPPRPAPARPGPRSTETAPVPPATETPAASRWPSEGEAGHPAPRRRITRAQGPPRLRPA